MGRDRSIEMVVQHVVLLKFVETATQEQKDLVVTELRKLPNVIPQIKSFRVGADLGLDVARNSHVSVVAEFENEADYQVYATHEAHLQVITTYIRPIIAQGGRTAVQSFVE
eukprot:c12703_g1_i1.p1 GENE.c12703_g1_i1~~c12703_g1_i1.p1  ORF type:complete len:111 (+),score=15.08 c12703_g1_i1:1-333(+)